jgi:S-adenosylmethionine-diacylglycerol 3-amino-3-carboxypropyl transferase
MRPPFNYGISQEDERTEATALGLPGGRVLSIASAGDMALSLLALGADEVVAVDIEPAQLHLARLKLCAVLSLERLEAIRFLGFMPAAPDRRLRWLASLRDRLPSSTREFWRERTAAVREGPIWAGGYERHLRLLRGLLWPFAGAFRELCDCGSPYEQAAIFARHFDRPLLRAAFRLAFTPRVYAGRGIDRRGLRHRDQSTSIGARFFERFRAMCVGSPARENPLLQLHLLGRVLDPDVVPEYLTERGVTVLRQRAHAISFVQSSLLDVLESVEAGRFDRFHLSNVPDWLDAHAFDRALELIAEKSARPGRLVWRYLHRNHPITATCLPKLHADEELGRALAERDRFPLYAVVSAEVGDETPAAHRTEIRRAS